MSGLGRPRSRVSLSELTASMQSHHRCLSLRPHSLLTGLLRLLVTLLSHSTPGGQSELLREEVDNATCLFRPPSRASHWAWGKQKTQSFQDVLQSPDLLHAPAPFPQLMSQPSSLSCRHSGMSLNQTHQCPQCHMTGSFSASSPSSPEPCV